MFGFYRMTLAVLLTLGVISGTTGCQSGSQRRVASNEPGLGDPLEPGTSVVEAPVKPARSTAWVDRHPLFSKPRDYYDKSGNNRVVKTAAATVIGIPAGLLGELRQIVVGAPATPRF
ncbi:MAG: hypothetical protein NVSMB9_25290 [Isosphaeraceae bacterium]